MERKTVEKITVKLSDGTEYEIKKGIALGINEESITVSHFKITRLEAMALLRTASQKMVEENLERFLKITLKGNQEEDEADG